MSGTVQAIVERNFNDSTEVMLFCLKLLQGGEPLDVTQPQESSLKSVCVSYLDQSVRTAERRIAEVARSQDSIARTGEENFASFWTPERAAALAAVGPRAALVERVRRELDPADHGKAECFRTAATREGVRSCFLALSLPVQRALAQS